MTDLDSNVLKIIEQLDEHSRANLLSQIRRLYPIHPIEHQWNSSAENILEAISGAGPLNQRAVKGMLAEATFKDVQRKVWGGFTDATPTGDLEYDVKLKKDNIEMRIQIKNQRSEKGAPKILPKGANKGAFVVETQKTRNGKDAVGNATRFYLAGSFDILAVCLYASTGNWDSFAFTLERWLLRKRGSTDYLAILQPIHLSPNSLLPVDVTWTHNLNECFEWLKSDRQGCVSF